MLLRGDSFLCAIRSCPVCLVPSFAVRVSLHSENNKFCCCCSREPCAVWGAQAARPSLTATGSRDPAALPQATAGQATRPRARHRGRAVTVPTELTCPPQAALEGSRTAPSLRGPPWTCRTPGRLRLQVQLEGTQASLRPRHFPRTPGPPQAGGLPRRGIRRPCQLRKARPHADRRRGVHSASPVTPGTVLSTSRGAWGGRPTPPVLPHDLAGTSPELGREG